MKQAKNAVERHVLWSDIHLDLDDWRDFLMENYPELPEDKLYEKMHRFPATQKYRSTISVPAKMSRFSQSPTKPDSILAWRKREERFL